MSDPGNFLARWLRRKREAAEAADQTTSPAATEPEAEPAHAAQAAPSDRTVTPGGAPEPTAPKFDPASLPAIESITADTDIRAFLAPGVPPELTHAALRRVWAADPKIRNFVGLADYDWDFNAAGSMAGFGPLEMTDELRQVVARIIGPPAADGMLEASVEIRARQEANEINPAEFISPIEQNDKNPLLAQAAPMMTPDESRPGDELTPGDTVNVAAQHRPEKPETSPSIVKRSHGRALPK